MRQMHTAGWRHRAGGTTQRAAVAACLLAASGACGAESPDAPRPERLSDLGESYTPGVDYPEALDRATVRRATSGRLPHESEGRFGMGPHATLEQVHAAIERAAVPGVAGPVRPTWQSLADHYQVPAWLLEGKFGIFIHFGLYAVPAHHNEWYQKHMYGNRGIRDWHIEQFGPLDEFGYKDFIPLFTLPAFDPDGWADLFKEAGATYVMPTVEHHDGFSLWDSKVNPFNSVNMGPRRDFTRELGDAVRARGMRFGITNHAIEHYDFIEAGKIPEGMKTDLDDPEWADFYWTQHSDERMVQHLANWLTRSVELIDQYQPDLIWYDNGVNHRMFDPLKLTIGAYYFNRARQWDKEVTFTGKGTSWLAGSLQDFEGSSFVTRERTPFTWFVHEKIGDRSWGYVEGLSARPASYFLDMLVDTVSRNGLFCLNVSPRGDGSIPEDQAAVLRAMGRWLSVNGRAVYGARVWERSGEGTGSDVIRFTVNDGSLFAVFASWPKDGLSIRSLPAGGEGGAVTAVHLQGGDLDLRFEQGPDGLRVALPRQAPAQGAPYVLRIQGPTTDGPTGGRAHSSRAPARIHRATTWR